MSDTISVTHVDYAPGVPAHSRIVSNDERDTEHAARLLAAHCSNDAILLLNGDLGAGKSLFARAFMNARRGAEDDVITGESPTFSLVSQYHTAHGPVTHFDLYRLESLEEVVHVGLEDALADPGILIIEWPELALPLLEYAGERTEIYIDSAATDGSRIIRICPPLPAGQ